MFNLKQNETCKRYGALYDEVMLLFRPSPVKGAFQLVLFIQYYNYDDDYYVVIINCKVKIHKTVLLVLP